ncbi:tocopherol cyclase family protein [[Clostridium] hylemonae]|uniref:Tocopherol cyclase n=1 Tax=[Clostridium] hylemonae DSM 15053 TaxID=553973 RepID=C0C5H0_9FIRM|nr:tocopherol cyclase family protein [[Clostridium] hylemonae]EEG72354.1 hypothetical protein CLOHYLEM_07354 [[Clostridium] hylemonae DSM 15053]QEK16539.1 hypothetical protein LAJLEIBI_00537 [[Clostridium] hylemonae DSM 15053]BDF03115.1 hypothetical protein CE91St63_01770 [[Clostridium] hylemonae]
MKKYPYFEGWYLKHQANGEMIAFIPAVHAGITGEWEASVQVITGEGAWNFPYPVSECSIDKKNFRIKIGDNLFSKKGIKVDLKNREMSIKGGISYGPFTGLKKDIMGPFRLLPFLECNHGVVSMRHRARGSVTVNGKTLDMTGGTGYIETDWGHSFPKEYVWTQCLFNGKQEGSIMLSAADVPLWGRSFRGVICAAYLGGHMYRMATYLGARIVRYNEREVYLKQRKLFLKVTKLGERSFGLYAPQKGSMSRIIRESPVCRVRYQMWYGKKSILDITDNNASFEAVRAQQP